MALTPEQIAEALVRSWYAGPYRLHHDEEIALEIAAVTAALRSYGKEVQERCAQLVDDPDLAARIRSVQL